MICLGKKPYSGEFEGRPYSGIKYYFADVDRGVHGYAPLEVKNPPDLDVDITDYIGKECDPIISPTPSGKNIFRGFRDNAKK